MGYFQSLLMRINSRTLKELEKRPPGPIMGMAAEAEDGNRVIPVNEL
jgi:hypothetical protein